MKPGTKDITEGKMHQVQGKIKETVGKAIGNSDLEAEGKAEVFGGILQEKTGRVEKVFDK